MDPTGRKTETETLKVILPNLKTPKAKKLNSNPLGQKTEDQNPKSQFVEFFNF